MDKLCIDVFIPGVNKSYDIKIAPNMNVKEAAKYIFKTISEYEMLMLDDDYLILCSKNNKEILDGSLTLEQCKIQDGSKMILI